MKAPQKITVSLAQIQHDLNVFRYKPMISDWERTRQSMVDGIITGIHSKTDDATNRPSGRLSHQPTLPIDALHCVHYWQHVFSFLADRALPRVSVSNRFFNTLIQRVGHPSLKRLRIFSTNRRMEVSCKRLNQAL